MVNGHTLSALDVVGSGGADSDRSWLGVIETRSAQAMSEVLVARA